jgi:hypothetical protein
VAFRHAMQEVGREGEAACGPRAPERAVGLAVPICGMWRDEWGAGQEEVGRVERISETARFIDRAHRHEMPRQFELNRSLSKERAFGIEI